MGWRPEEGYYQKHVEVEGFSNKITEEQKAFNKLSPEDTREGIAIASAEIAKEKGTLTREEQIKSDIVDNIMEHKSDYEEFFREDEEEER